MLIVDKIVELFQKHKGKQFLDVRGSACRQHDSETGVPQRIVLLQFDFKDEATGLIDASNIELMAQVENEEGPDIESALEEADLRLVRAWNDIFAERRPEAFMDQMRQAFFGDGENPRRESPSEEK
jgi:hypothetical protein